jgi:hypothetical protein
MERKPNKEHMKNYHQIRGCVACRSCMSTRFPSQPTPGSGKEVSRYFTLSNGGDEPIWGIIHEYMGKETLLYHGTRKQGFCEGDNWQR